jgi:hypothetical protein
MIYCLHSFIAYSINACLNISFSNTELERNSMKAYLKTGETS